MKLLFEIELDEARPTGKSSAGNPKWNVQTEVEIDGKKYSVYIDVYQRTAKPEPKTAKPVVKVKA